MDRRSAGRTAWLWSLCLAGATSACASDETAASDLHDDANDVVQSGEVVAADSAGVDTQVATEAPDAVPSDALPSSDTLPLDTLPPGETAQTCDPCTGLGSLKGRVCSPSESVFISGATVTVSGTGCNGAPFTQTVESGIDGTYYLLDLPCGVHTLQIGKGSFQTTHTVTIRAGQLSDVSGAANKLCMGASAAKIAVLDGSYDNIESLVAQLGLAYDFYNDKGDDGADGANLDLLGDSAKLQAYDVVFANCGGNHGWMPQEHPEVMDNVKDFVLTGGSLYMSDYAWVYGEWAFPDKVDWAGNDDVNAMGNTAVSPQQIPSGTSVTAKVVDGTLASYLGKNTLAVTFDQGPQIAPQSVAGGAFAHVVADVSVPFGFQGTNVPLVISYVPSQGAGRVIYTNFHNDAQTSADMLTILQYLVFTLEPPRRAPRAEAREPLRGLYRPPFPGAS